MKRLGDVILLLGFTVTSIGQKEVFSILETGFSHCRRDGFCDDFTFGEDLDIEQEQRTAEHLVEFLLVPENIIGHRVFLFYIIAGKGSVLTIHLPWSVALAILLADIYIISVSVYGHKMANIQIVPVYIITCVNGLNGELYNTISCDLREHRIEHEEIIVPLRFKSPWRIVEAYPGRVPVELVRNGGFDPVFLSYNLANAWEPFNLKFLGFESEGAGTVFTTTACCGHPQFSRAAGCRAPLCVEFRQRADVDKLPTHLFGNTFPSPDS